MQKKIKIIIAALLIIYLLFGAFTIRKATDFIMDDYHTILSNMALDVAQIAAEKLLITDKEFEELKAIDYVDTPQNSAYQRLEQIFYNRTYSSEIKYAYIVHWLSSDEIKYTVPEDMEDFYGATAGTPLDLLWLCDVRVDKNEQKAIDADENYYDDFTRYSIMRDDVVAAYNKKQPSSAVIKDEYGTAITGFVPIYTDTGRYIGLLCVDLFFQSYSDRLAQMELLLMLIFLSPTIVLSAIYIIMYITRIKKSENEAKIDALSNLYNRRHFDKMLPSLIKAAFNEKKPFAVIMVDIDYFKKYNDNYGHSAGDDVIRKTADAITCVLRKNQDIVFRYGGEEFVALMPDTDPSGALNVAEKIRLSVEKTAIPHLCSDTTDHITISLGVFAMVPKASDKATATDFIVKADQALYKAKMNGRNRCELYR